MRRNLLRLALLLCSAVYAAAQPLPPVLFPFGGGSGGGGGGCTGAFCLATAPLAATLGGTGLDNSGSTGVPLWTAGVQSILGTSGTGSVARIASPTFSGTLSAAAMTLSGTLTTNLTGGGTQCVQASNTGVLSGTGSACGSGGGAVSSVFGRTGAVIAASADYTFAQIGSKPTTVAGYGITDALTTALTSAHILIGNAGIATDTALSGDAALSNLGVLTLSTVNANTGACGDSTHVCQVTLDGKGRATAASAVLITAGGSTVVQPATTSPAITVNGGTGGCSTTCNIGIQEAQSPNTTHFGDASYTIVASDLGTTLPRTNASAMTDTLPDTGSAGFGQGVSLAICASQAAQDTVSRQSGSQFIFGNALVNSVVIPRGACAKFSNINNTNWNVSLLSAIAVGITPVNGGTNKAVKYNNNGLDGELAVVNNAVVSTNASGVPAESTTLPSGLSATNLALTTPTLGTPVSGDLSNTTNFPVASLSGLGANVASALAASASGSSGGFCRSVGSACSGQAGGGVVTYSSGALTALTAGTYFTPFGGGGSPVATETAVQTKAPAASTVANLQVDLSVDPGNTNTIAITARNNTTDQTTTCTITGNGSTNLTCSDTTHSFNPAQGDKLTFKVVNSATYTGTINITATWGTTNVGVTSVTVTVPSRETATGCVITTSGTCAITDNNQTANTALRGPSSGAAAAPTFRAAVAADDYQVGNYKKYIANNWYAVNPMNETAISVLLAAGSTNTVVWTPFTVNQTVTISNIGLALQTSGGTNGGMALYADSGGLPTGSPICSASVATTSTGVISMACSTQLVQGTVYWWGNNEDSATAKAIATRTNQSMQIVGTSSSANFGSVGNERLTTTSVTCCATGNWPTNPTVTHTSNLTTYQVVVFIQVASIP